MQSSQNSGVPKKNEAKIIDFEKLPEFKLIRNFEDFKSEVCSRSRFPTEAMVWINEIDAARNMAEINSSSSILVRTIQKLRMLSRIC